jgi:hypothetical protein
MVFIFEHPFGGFPKIVLAPHAPYICLEDRYRCDQFEPETIAWKWAGWLLETASSLPYRLSLPHAGKK